jgi:hypothetical protein
VAPQDGGCGLSPITGVARSGAPVFEADEARAHACSGELAGRVPRLDNQTGERPLLRHQLSWATMATAGHSRAPPPRQ